jgi:hypothetical protein
MKKERIKNPAGGIPADLVWADFSGATLGGATLTPPERDVPAPTATTLDAPAPAEPTKLAVWLMRHTPEESVVAHFAGLGYKVVTLADYLASIGDTAGAGFSWPSGKAAAELAQAVAAWAGAAAPDVVIGIIPMPMIPEFIRFTSAPLLRLPMEAVRRDGDAAGGKSEYRWTGAVERIVQVQIVTEPWPMAAASDDNVPE